MIEYGELIREERRLRGISQHALAREVGISHMTVIAIENNENVSINILEKVCERLGIKISFKTKTKKNYEKTLRKKYYPARLQGTEQGCEPVREDINSGC